MSKDYNDYLTDIDNIDKVGLQYQQEQDNYTMRKAKSYLFFDDDVRIDFLASERFPNDPRGSEKYVNINGELYFEDPRGEKVFNNKKYTREFPNNESVGFFADKIVPNLAPAATFAADVGGGMAGARFGFKKGLVDLATGANPLAKGAQKNPYAAGAYLLGTTAIGGFSGNVAAGAVPRTAREIAINQFYSLPAEEIAAASKDLMISSSFSLIPFGQGSVGTGSVINLFRKDPDTLTYLLNLRKDADTVMREAKKFGFDLTPAQAKNINKRASNIQYYLSQQPDNRAIMEFYDSQASQVAEAINVFADSIGSQTGRVGDVNQRIVDTSKEVMEELTRRRKARATKIYNSLKNTPDGIEVGGIQGVIDLIDSKIAGEVLDGSGNLIRVIEPSPSTVKNLEKFKKIFYKEDGTLVTDLMELDARRTSEMKALAFKLQGKGTGDAGQLYGIMDNMTALMDEAHPDYALARRVYDPNKPALQLVEKSAIGRFGKIMTDKQTANAMKELFNPNVSVKSLQNSKRILQTADPELFKDIKKQYMIDVYDRFYRAQDLQKGMPQLQKHFMQEKNRKMMQVMLEPEEYKNFYKMNELMGMAFSISPGSSQTQPLTEMAGKMLNEAKSNNIKAVQLGQIILNTPGKIVSGRLGDDMINRISKEQQYKYQEVLTDILLTDPDAGNTLDEVYRFFSTNDFIAGQTGLRGVVEGSQSITEPSVQEFQSEDIRNQEPTDFDQYLQDIENISPDSGAMNIPAPSAPTDLSPPQMLSPTILPDEKDREIAMRRVGGLGSLV
jgi:hypothetical protein